MCLVFVYSLFDEDVVSVSVGIGFGYCGMQCADSMKCKDLVVVLPHLLLLLSPHLSDSRNHRSTPVTTRSYSPSPQ